MPDSIAVCPKHGPCEGESCPVCGRSLDPVLSGSRRRRLSKYLSGALRHFPGDAGIDLYAGGWTDFDDLVAAAERQYGWADTRAVTAVIATDPKGRFERDDGRVRAAYGHSVAVDLESGGTPVPDTLYHGTAPRNLDSILSDGLRPMSRQQVHLSGTVEAAREVGARHADHPVILEVDAAGMLKDGHEITKRGRAVYTTDRVPPEYLDER
ncbi:MAG: RNA 2'-phosphotransferase [Halapricum sp.]